MAKKDKEDLIKYLQEDSKKEPKESLKKYFLYLKNELKESRVFIFLLIMTAAFVLGPVLLHISLFSDLLADFLSPLVTQEYKSVYLEAISTLMGTFLAIYGALWTQRRIDSKDEVKRKRAALVVVYYDFDFAYEDLKNMFYEKDESNKFHKSEINPKTIIENIVERGTENLFIDEGWIRNVASLSDVFGEADLKKIFEMYGEINTIKMLLDGMKLNKGSKEDQDNNDKEIERIETIINSIFTVKNDDEDDEIVLCNEYEKIKTKLYTKITDSYTKSWKLFHISDDIQDRKKQ